MRLGQKNALVRQWARKGTRPRQPKDQRYKSAYLFGAVAPAQAKGAALVMPRANTHAMQAHLEEIARMAPPALMPSSCSTRPDGTPPKSSSGPKT